MYVCHFLRFQDNAKGTTSRQCSHGPAQESRLVCKQSLIREGGQLLGNDDGVKISLGSALPVGKSFQCMVHDI